ncbi:hypothetical protein LOK49_LG12G02985 [Camellia lanceoleosa]|uniref:Uncharacterized protein n=1 Tax=Camellia lanceoleosa TaxID=1840588 RepID=A0ACC0FN48_9ERIC|nr:hypothetical protein LOK49_LG12G02985 [Camellia lanceoleosa]
MTTPAWAELPPASSSPSPSWYDSSPITTGENSPSHLPDVHAPPLYRPYFSAAAVAELHSNATPLHLLNMCHLLKM